MADPLDYVLAGDPASVIQLSPASKAFVDNRATTLGTWVIGGTLDCVFFGIVLCQVQHFFQNRRLTVDNPQNAHTYVVYLVTFLSLLKTIQAIAIIWQQNVIHFADPDVARTLVSGAWWQVSQPLMTGIIGSVVQCFYATRYFKLTRNYYITILIAAAILLGIVGSCLSTYHIVKAHVKEKVTWLLVHLVSVFIADLLITLSTVYALYIRGTGLSSTTSLINRLLRMVFEAAVPPAFIAMVDLILTQTLGTKLLWHLVLNYSLGKIYVISLLYTVNSIGDYRSEKSSDGKVTYSHGNVRITRRGDIEMGSQFHSSNLGQVQVQTQVTTHVSPPANGIEIRGYGKLDKSEDRSDDEYVVKDKVFAQ